MKSKNNYKLTTRYKKQSQRQLKVAQSIRTHLIDCFMREGKISQELQNMPLNIIEVNISPDLRIANCFFTPFNTDLSVDILLTALEKSKYVIRDFVTKRINLKYSPEIRFYYDHLAQNLEEVDYLLRK